MSQLARASGLLFAGVIGGQPRHHNHSVSAHAGGRQGRFVCVCAFLRRVVRSAAWHRPVEHGTRRVFLPGRRAGRDAQDHAIDETIREGERARSMAPRRRDALRAGSVALRAAKGGARGSARKDSSRGRENQRRAGRSCAVARGRVGAVGHESIAAAGHAVSIGNDFGEHRPRGGARAWSRGRSNREIAGAIAGCRSGEVR